MDNDTTRANLLLANTGKTAIGFSVGFGFVAGYSGVMLAFAVALANKQVDLYAIGAIGLTAGAGGAIVGFVVWLFLWARWLRTLLGMGDWYGRFGWSELHIKLNKGRTLRLEQYPVHRRYWNEMAHRALNGSKPTFRGWGRLYFTNDSYFTLFVEQLVRRGYAVPEGEAYNAPLVWTVDGLDWWSRILEGEIEVLPYPGRGGDK